MSRLTYVLLVFSVLFSSAQFNPEGIKGPFKYKPKIEPSMGQLQINNFNVPSYNPRVDGRNNWVTVTLVDSSANGYGLVSGQTRPLFITEDEQWFLAYRQYCGEGTTHGQLGGAYSEDGEEWANYWNINANGNPPWGGGGGWTSGQCEDGLCAQARYPSVLATEDFPIAVWTEFTNDTSNGSAYGGRPYYTYDEFGWDGGSFIYPMDLDYGWFQAPKDLWQGSPSIVEDVVIISYDDWSRTHKYVFNGFVDEGQLIMENETLVFEVGTGDIYSTEDGYDGTPSTSMNQYGDSSRGIVGLTGWFSGGLDLGSPIMNRGTFMLKLTEDGGYSWSETPRYIPEHIFQEIISEYFQDYNEIDGEFIDISGMYNYDMKMDASDNIHIVMQLVYYNNDSGETFFCDQNGHDNGSGWYHFKISFDDLLSDNPEEWNWEYSKVVTGAYTWCFQNQWGNSYIWDSQAQLAFDEEEGEDLVHIIADLGVPGEETYEENSHDYGSQWSQDIFIFRSEDGGQSWWNPLNVSNTSSFLGDEYPLEEQYPHAFQWGMNEEVYFVYQMPNWNWNELNDPIGADYMNYVYVAKASFVDDNQPSYPWSNCNDPEYMMGDLNQDQVLDILDIIMYVNVIVFSDYSLIDGLCQIEQADINDDENIDIFDIIEVINIIFN